MRFPFEITPEPIVSKTPIEDFAEARIFKQTEGIDTDIAFKQGYVYVCYYAVIYSRKTMKKHDDSPDLHEHETRFEVRYNSAISSYLPSHRHGIHIFIHNYIDGKYQDKYISCQSDHTIELDSSSNCTFLLEHWDDFVEALDNIAEQIKKDCNGEPYLKNTIPGCQKAILRKIEESTTKNYK